MIATPQTATGAMVRNVQTSSPRARLVPPMQNARLATVLTATAVTVLVRARVRVARIQ